MSAQAPMDITIKRKIADSQLEVEGPFAATDLIRTLLLFHTASVDSNRHVHLSHQVFDRCLDAYSAIHKLMRICHQAVKLDRWHLQVIDFYLRAIPELERILLSFQLDSDDGTDSSRKYVPDNEDIVGCLVFIETWLQDRHSRIIALQDLRSNELLVLSNPIPDREIQNILDFIKTAVQNEYSADRSQDDKATIAALVSFFQSFSDGENLGMSPVERTVRNGITSAFQMLRAPFATDEHSELFIKALMLLSIPFSLLSTSNDQSTKQHLVRHDIWQAMEKCVTEIEDPTKLETNYVNLRNLLLPTDTVTEMLELIKLSTRIRPPYHQRSVALVKILRFLDEESLRKEADTMQRHALKEVLQSSIQVLQNTDIAMTGSTAIILSDADYQRHDAVFRAHLGQVETCCRTLNFSNQWSSKEAEFNRAVVLDENHFDQLRQKLNLP